MRALMPVISFGLSFWRGEPSMSTKGCLLVIGGFFIGTVGLVLFIALMATGFKDMHKNSIVIEGEGTCTVTLEKGDYTFFIEGTDNITPLSLAIRHLSYRSIRCLSHDNNPNQFRLHSWSPEGKKRCSLQD